MVKVRFNDQPIQIRVQGAALVAHQSALAQDAADRAQGAAQMAADLVAAENIFVAADLATARSDGEAGTITGTYFKAVGVAEGEAEIRVRTSGGSDLLYVEMTKPRIVSAIEAATGVAASEYSASPGATWQDNFDAINAAIDAVHASRGETVLLPPGDIPVNGIIQKARVTLALQYTRLVNPD